MARKRLAARVPIEERDADLRALDNAAKSMGGDAWSSAEEELRPVCAVPTILVQLDRATQVGGWPTERVAVAHGPSGEGKTTLELALHRSFLERRHLACFVEAELTTPASFLRTAFGPDLSRTVFDDKSPRYKVMRPETYEEAVDGIRTHAKDLQEKRDAKGSKIPEDTTCIYTIDSIRKLVPEDLMSRLKKFGAQGEKGSTDGYGGRGAQFKAALNAQWLDELVPLAYHTRTSVLFITREAEGEDEDDIKVGGGRALYYDSSLVVRVTASPLWDKDEKRLVGTAHRCRIRKTKLAPTTTEHARFNFYTSNGVHAPEGFWRARDVLELARFFGIVETTGAWLSWRGEKHNGEKRMLGFLADARALADLEVDVRARFGTERRDDLGAPLSDDDLAEDDGKAVVSSLFRGKKKA